MLFDCLFSFKCYFNSDQFHGSLFANISNVLQFDVNNVLELPNAINVQPYNQLFLRSDLGLGYDAIGADGSGDIVRRIVCAVPLNNLVVDTHSLPTDTISIGHRQIQSLSFRLTDVYGKIVDTRGHPISFSLILVMRIKKYFY